MVDKKNDPFDPSYDFLDETNSANDGTDKNTGFGDLDSIDFEHEEELNPDLDLPPSDHTTMPGIPPKKSGIMEMLKTYGVVAVVFLVVAYFGIKYSFKSSSRTAEPEVVAESEPAVDATAPGSQTTEVTPSTIVVSPSQEVKTETTTTPVAISPIQPASVSPVSSAVDTQALSGIKQDMDSLKNMVTDINKQLQSSVGEESKNSAELKQQMQQLVTYVQGIGTSVGVLSEGAQKQQKVLEGLIATSPISKTNKNINKSYTIDALISGRAWLKSSNGNSIVVGVGDELSGFGKIIEIDATTNTITTNSGQIIK